MSGHQAIPNRPTGLANGLGTAHRAFSRARPTRKSTTNPAGWVGVEGEGCFYGALGERGIKAMVETRTCVIAVVAHRSQRGQGVPGRWASAAINEVAQMVGSLVSSSVGKQATWRQRVMTREKARKVTTMAVRGARKKN